MMGKALTSKLYCLVTCLALNVRVHKTMIVSSEKVRDNCTLKH